MSDDLDLTPLRREVLDMIKASARPIKAYELLGLLSRRRGRVARAPTIYRTLDYLTRCGLIHRIESLNAYQACAHAPACPEHVFLICDDCGEVSEIESMDARIALEIASTARQFRAEQVSIEVHGACRACGTETPARAKKP
ncbi:MAG: transcriptional repressor [Hyphomonadaceae bacterium JAD_PAG50586_4]|nr:MAG: transcriptional repressor [Hyphomonadaceae bacterium JAD_PAG50586_4]